MSDSGGVCTGCPLPGLRKAQTPRYYANIARVRGAGAVSHLPPMSLAALVHGKPLRQAVSQDWAALVTDAHCPAEKHCLPGLPEGLRWCRRGGAPWSDSRSDKRFSRLIFSGMMPILKYLDGHGNTICPLFRQPCMESARGAASPFHRGRLTYRGDIREHVYASSTALWPRQKCSESSPQQINAMASGKPQGLGRPYAWRH